MGVKDAAGMTRGEVERLGPEGVFDLVGERYARMQELMTEAQLVVSSEPWVWGSPGLAPQGGPTAYDPLPGATMDNAHFMEMTRIIAPEGAVGAVADARPVYDYFVSKGWEVSLTENDFAELELEYTHDFRVRAITEDGYRMQYTVQQNGYYNMEIMSDLFWGDSDEILTTILDRVPGRKLFPQDLPAEVSPKPGSTIPGVYTPYPKWSDPVVPLE